MAEPRARVFEFEVAYDGAGHATAKDAGLDVPERWAPEHLVLAGLLDCSLTSLRYHAKRAGIVVANATGGAAGTVTRREDDGRFAFVEIGCRFEVELDPAPADPTELLLKAERDCFVGASLTAKPTYVWNVA